MRRLKLIFYLFFVFAILPVTAQTKKEFARADQNVGDWRYDVICNGSGGSDTSYLLEVSVYVPDIRLGLEQAKKSAIHAILFKGIVGNNEGCSPKDPLAGPESERQNQQYYDSFFFNEVMYSKFATVPTGVPKNVQELIKKKSYRVDYIVSVSVDNLRAQLELDGVIESLAVDDNVQKPTITILPDQNFLIDQGFKKMTKPDADGNQKILPDYERAYQESNDIRTVIAKLENLLQGRGYQPINAFAANQGALEDKVFDQAYSGSENGGEIEVSDLDKLLSGAKADIYWEFDWKVNDNGFDKKLNYTVRALDAYLKTSIATETGEGPSSFSASMPELLTQAITDKMDGFLVKHQTHFKDIIENGRPVKLSFRTADIGLNFTSLIEDEFGESELGDLVIDYVAYFSVKSGNGTANFNRERFQTRMALTNVRIPLEITIRGRNGETVISNDATEFLKAMQKDFRRNLDIDGIIITLGLGEAVFIIGGR